MSHRDFDGFRNRIIDQVADGFRSNQGSLPTNFENFYRSSSSPAASALLNNMEIFDGNNAKFDKMFDEMFDSARERKQRNSQATSDISSLPGQRSQTSVDRQSFPPSANEASSSERAPTSLSSEKSAPPMREPDSMVAPESDPLNKSSDSSGALPSMGENIDRYDEQIIQAAKANNVPPERVKAIVALESGGTGDPNAVQINSKYGNTYGVTQINPAIWGDTAVALGYDLQTVEGQLGMAAYILREGYEATGGKSWSLAHSWYFNPSGTGDSVNGTSNAQYVARIDELIGAV